MVLNSELDGILVVSLEQAVAAPYCGLLLADAGARVIKVERPDGDFARGYDSGVNGNSAIFAWLNRGKESICLNLKDAEDLSLMRGLLSKADVFAEDKLFATLDTTVRKVVIQNMPFLLTDTVGFIRKLPTQLVDSFKSTLTEITEADLLIHVIDISHPNYKDHIKSVNFILGEIEAHGKPILMVFNKTDKYFNDKEDIKDVFDIEYEDNSLQKLINTLTKEYKNRSYFISALDKFDIQKLKKELYNKVREIHITRFPYNAFLYPDII